MHSLISLPIIVLCVLPVSFGSPSASGNYHPGGGGLFHNIALAGTMMAGSASTFDGVVAVKSAYDTNADDKPDEIYHFRRHSIERIEWDIDFDGRFDLRAIYAKPADGRSNLEYRLERIDQQYRLVPYTAVEAYPMHGGFPRADPPPRYEARIDGAWTDSFKLDLPLKQWGYIDDATDLGATTFVCENGAAVSLTTQARPETGGQYQQTLFENGKAISSVTGASPERLTRKTRFIDGEDRRSITLTDRDGDGEFELEFTERSPNRDEDHQTTRMKIDGQWTGTFVDQGRRYVDGRITEVVAVHTETVVERRKYDKRGRLLWTINDSDGDGVFDMRRKPDGTTHQFKDGNWIGDFVTETLGPSGRFVKTYRGGRLVRSEAINHKEGRHTIIEYPRPGVEIVKTSGMVFDMDSHVWNYYATERGQTTDSLLRSAHDKDGDGKPDVFVDYQSLTITDTQPADWPK